MSLTFYGMETLCYHWHVKYWKEDLKGSFICNIHNGHPVPVRYLNKCNRWNFTCELNRMKG